jgi:hypothetical protein
MSYGMPNRSKELAAASSLILFRPVVEEAGVDSVRDEQVHHDAARRQLDREVKMEAASSTPLSVLH